MGVVMNVPLSGVPHGNSLHDATVAAAVEAQLVRLESIDILEL